MASQKLARDCAEEAGGYDGFGGRVLGATQEIGSMTEILIGIVSAIVAAAALWFTWTSWKIKELRKDEILAWSLDCIDILQRTQMTLSVMETSVKKSDFSEILKELKLRSSVQVERGRLFFLNVSANYGNDKPVAYRGLRPVILDCLVANCQICDRACESSPEMLLKLKHLSLDYTREFVSYAQQEVGRSRKSKSGAEAAGNPVDIAFEVRNYGNNSPKTY